MFELRTQNAVDVDLEVIGEQNSVVIGEFPTPERAIREAVSRAAPNFPMFVSAPNGAIIYAAKR